MADAFCIIVVIWVSISGIIWTDNSDHADSQLLTTDNCTVLQTLQTTLTTALSIRNKMYTIKEINEYYKLMQ